MFKLEAEDENYLKHSIEIGEAVLVLGAGASATSLNKSNEPVKTALQLAEALTHRAGLPYAGETLTEVLGAVRQNFLSDEQILSILINEYKGVTPSKELEELFNIVWKRLYTWNIDDSLENTKNSAK